MWMKRNQKCFCLHFHFLKVYPVFLTPGVLERGHVCDVRAAETSNDGSKSQLQSLSVISTVSRWARVRPHSHCLSFLLSSSVFTEIFWQSANKNRKTRFANVSVLLSPDRHVATWTVQSIILITHVFGMWLIFKRQSLLDQILPLSRKRLGELKVKSNYEVSSLGRILGQRHSFSGQDFLVSRADMTWQTNQRAET